MRGATIFNPLSTNNNFISIHAPHAGRDEFTPTERDNNTQFQSTRPMRGATIHVLAI